MIKLEKMAIHFLCREISSSLWLRLPWKWLMFCFWDFIMSLYGWWICPCLRLSVSCKCYKFLIQTRLHTFNCLKLFWTAVDMRCPADLELLGTWWINQACITSYEICTIQLTQSFPKTLHFFLRLSSMNYYCTYHPIGLPIYNFVLIINAMFMFRIFLIIVVVTLTYIHEQYISPGANELGISSIWCALMIFFSVKPLFNIVTSFRISKSIIYSSLRLCLAIVRLCQVLCVPLSHNKTL